MKTIASFGAGRRALTTLGVSPRQYQLLVDLFGALGERKELFGNLGMDRHALQLTTLMLVIPGGFLSLLAFGSMSLATYNLITLGVSSLVLFLLLVLEASNSFLNPAEVSVLAHRPISGATYFAAKFSYLIAVVIRAEAALNGPAALTGLIKAEARWFYPLTHMAAACLAGVFLALIACALFGVLFRLVPKSRLRSAALWVQLVITTGPLAINFGLRPLRRLLTPLLPTSTGIDWSFVPLTWFNALALVGQGGGAASLGWPAVIGGITSAGFIGYGVRALSAGYMARIVGVMRATRGRRAWRARSSAPGRLVRLLTGQPSGHAAAEFVWRLMRRDWQFRRAAIQLVLPLLLFGPAVFISGRDGSPFEPGRTPIVGLLPEIVPLHTLTFCLVLSFSDHFKGAWVFGTASAAALRGYVRGIYCALWLPFIALPFAASLLYFSWHWGVGDAALFSTYGLAVASFLFGFELLLIGGLPFGRPPKPEQPHLTVMLMAVVGAVLGLAWFVQGHLIFRARWTTAIATLVFVYGAVLSARLGLQRLDRKVQQDLARHVGNGPRLFDDAISIR